MSHDIPENLRTFITDHVGSIAQLELLLLLHKEAGRTWSVQEAAQALYTSEEMTGPMLESLQSLGLVEATDEGRYRFAPKTPGQEEFVDQLAQLYAERRVTVINLIYSGPEDKLRNFANAFRFRWPKKDG